MKHFSFSALIFLVISSASMGQPPARIGIAGLSHSHVVPLLRNLDRAICKAHKIDKNLLFESLDEMLDKTRPDGVFTFTSIIEHLEVVEACARRGIDVMVEKPLAVSTEHAGIMAKLSEEAKHVTYFKQTELLKP